MSDSENVTSEGVEVKVGQVWRDLDPAWSNRHCKVKAALFGKATLVQCHPDGREFGERDVTVAIRTMHKSDGGWVRVEGVQ